MQRLCLILVLCILGCSTGFAKGSKAIKKGMTKAQVLKKLGKPSKILQSKIKNHKYYIWYTKSAAQAVLLNKNRVDGDVLTFEALIQGIDEMSFVMKNGISDLQQDLSKLTENTPKAESKPEAKKNNTSAKIDTSQIHIEVLEAEKTKGMFDDREKAGFKLKIKNNTNKTIAAIKIKVHFLDTAGKVFYELDLHIKNTLKPNYSLLLPEQSNTQYTTPGLDTSEWDEGKVTITIIDVELEP